MTKITNRIKQIDYSLQQAQQMFDSMDKFKHLVVRLILDVLLHDMFHLLICLSLSRSSARYTRTE